MPHINRSPMQLPPVLKGGLSVKRHVSPVPALVALVGALMLVATLSGCASPGVQEYDPWQGDYNCPGCLPDCV
jgi:hypothetical protein